MYVAPIVGSSAGANKFHLSLFNGSGRPIEIYKITAIPHTTAAITGTLVVLSVNRITANGTTSSTATMRKLNTKHADAPASVVAGTAWSANPTEASNPELCQQAINNEETAAQSPMPLWEADASIGVEPITLHTGQGVVVKQGALAGAGAVSIYIYWRHKKGKSNGV